MMKRIISYIVAIIMALSMQGCNRKTETYAAGNIKVMAYGEYLDLVHTAAEKFKEKDENKNINIEIETLKSNLTYEDFKKDVEGNADLVILPGFTSEDMVLDHSDIFQSLNNYVENYGSNFSKDRLATLTTEKQLKALPLDMRPVAFYYRGDILNSMGISEKDIVTWQDILNMKDSMKERNMKALGITLEGDMSFYHLLLNCLGEDYVDSDSILASTLDSDESKEVFILLKNLYNNKMIKIYASEDEMIKGALNGEVFGFLGSNMALNKLKSSWSDKGWSVMKAPAFEAGGNRALIQPGSNVFMLKSSDNKDIAAQFMTYMCADKEVLLWAMNNIYMMPAYSPIYKNEIFDFPISDFGGKKLYRFFETIINTSNKSSYNIKSCHIDTYLEEKLNTIIENDNLDYILKEEAKDINLILNK